MFGLKMEIIDKNSDKLMHTEYLPRPFETLAEAQAKMQEKAEFVLSEHNRKFGTCYVFVSTDNASVREFEAAPYKKGSNDPGIVRMSAFDIDDNEKDRKAFAHSMIDELIKRLEEETGSNNGVSELGRLI
jgi:hypothetical protein